MPEFKQHTLPSGLRVVAEIDQRGYSASIGFFVRAGARDENDRQSGLSHFLEHMMFKGTDRRTAADVNRELDELGGQSNAYTSEEQTVYYATVLPKFQDRIVDLLGDMMTPKLDESEFETEKQVILEEIAKYEDQPPFGAFERSMELKFGPRGLGRRILGTPESIEAMSPDDLRQYFRWRYRPENIVVAASGSLDFDQLVRQIENATVHWSRRQSATVFEADDPGTLPPGISLDQRIGVADLHQSYVVSIANGPSSTDEDRYATRVLAAVMGDEGGSRLFWDLIDTGRAEVATVWSQEFEDDGAWFTYLICDPEDVQSNQRLIDDVAKRLINDGVTQAELDQTINKAVASSIMSAERPSSRLFGLGSRFLIHNKYRSLDESIECLRSLTVQDINAAAAKVLVGQATQVIAEAKPSDAEATPSDA